MGALTLWLCGAVLLIWLVIVLAVWSAARTAGRDDDLLDRTKTFRQVFRESRPKEDKGDSNQ